MICTESKCTLKLHIRESKGKPTHSFIFLHGYDCSGRENADHFKSWAHANTTAYPGIRVVCPDAHMIGTSARGYGDKLLHSWYDFENGDCNSPDDKPDLKTLEASCREIHTIIESEANIVGSLARVFLGGVSQGCGTAFHAAATCPIGPIGGFYGSIGHIMPCTNVSDITNRISGPIVFYLGTDDDVMSWSWVKGTILRLHHVPLVEIWREDGIEHEDDGHWIANFLCRIIPPPSVMDQIISYDKRDNSKL